MYITTASPRQSPIHPSSPPTSPPSPLFVERALPESHYTHTPNPQYPKPLYKPNMRPAEKTSSALPAIAQRFVRCYWQPARSLALLQRHPRLCDQQTRSLLERDAHRLLRCPEAHSHARALSIVCAVALLEMCAGRPPREVRRHLAGLTDSGGKTCQEHRMRAQAILARLLSGCEAERQTRRRVRVKFRRGAVALNYEQRDLDRRLETMSFDEASETLRRMSLEEREAALDRLTQVRFWFPAVDEHLCSDCDCV